MLETTILENLIHNTEFRSKTLPYLTPEYFRGANRIVFNLINSFVLTYNASPTKEALLIDLDNKHKNSTDEHTYQECVTLVDSFDEQPYELQWLLDGTEKFCQEKAVYNALYASIAILEGKNKKADKGSIPQLLTNALGVSFDSRIGHDYLEDAAARWEYYNNPENKIPFNIEMLDTITNGGVTRKTLSLFMGGVGFGKTMILCNLAANFMQQGLNVIYFTMEMAEEEISRRIDANLLDCELNDIAALPKDVYLSRIGKYRANTSGKLIIREFSAGSVNANHFRHVLHEAKLKTGFVADVGIFDYLNLAASFRIKPIDNMYLYNKFIAEEIRGLMVDENMAGFSATQTNRDGFNSSDPDMTNTSESFGVPATMDFQVAIISSQDLADMQQLMFKQIKNRFGDVYKNAKFAMGVDRAKQRVYNLEDATANLAPTKTQIPKSFGEFNSGQDKFKFNPKNFEGFT